MKLYIRSSCPYCKKVLTAAEKLGLKEGKDFTVIDASPGTPGREVVLQVGGKQMVPFLIDGEVSMYESDDIIAYMKQGTNT
ncbi:glutathione S-transferase N-terminal domain-containing protein [Desulfocastanea catecholica]